MDNTSTPWSDFIDTMQQEMEQYIKDEAYKKLSSMNPKIEISLAFEGEEFEHEGYYNTPDEAIEALKAIKDIYYNDFALEECLDEDGSAVYETNK